VEDSWESVKADLVPGEVTMVTIPVVGVVVVVVESEDVVANREIVPVASIRVVRGGAAWEKVRRRLGRRRRDRKRRDDLEGGGGIGWEAIIFTP